MSRQKGAFMQGTDKMSITTIPEGAVPKKWIWKKTICWDMSVPAPL